jgi:hypothetical protein
MRLCSRGLAILIFLLASAAAFAHPGGGMVPIDENNVIIPDPMNNFVWLVTKGSRPFPVVENFHAHWITRGLDGHLYAESFGEMGGALYRIFLSRQAKIKIAEETDLNVHVFAVGKDGEIIFQKGGNIVERRPDGSVRPFRGSGVPIKGGRSLGPVLAYTWDGDLLWLSDGNTVARASKNGEIHPGSTAIDGQLLSPQIWNSTGKPRIWSIAKDASKRLYFALPDLGQVVRVETNGKQSVIAQTVGGWRTTAVAAYGDHVFMLESSDRSNDGPRVRVIRPGGTIELLGEIKPEHVKNWKDLIPATP